MQELALDHIRREILGEKNMEIDPRFGVANLDDIAKAQLNIREQRYFSRRSGLILAEQLD